MSRQRVFIDATIPTILTPPQLKDGVDSTTFTSEYCKKAIEQALQSSRSKLQVRGRIAHTLGVDIGVPQRQKTLSRAKATFAENINFLSEYLERNDDNMTDNDCRPETKDMIIWILSFYRKVDIDPVFKLVAEGKLLDLKILWEIFEDFRLYGGHYGLCCYMTEKNINGDITESDLTSWFHSKYKVLFYSNESDKQYLRHIDDHVFKIAKQYADDKAGEKKTWKYFYSAVHCLFSDMLTIQSDQQSEIIRAFKTSHDREESKADSNEPIDILMFLINNRRSDIFDDIDIDCLIETFERDGNNTVLKNMVKHYKLLRDHHDDRELQVCLKYTFWFSLDSDETMYRKRKHQRQTVGGISYKDEAIRISDFDIESLDREKALQTGNSIVFGKTPSSFNMRKRLGFTGPSERAAYIETFNRNVQKLIVYARGQGQPFAYIEKLLLNVYQEPWSYEFYLEGNLLMFECLDYLIKNSSLNKKIRKKVILECTAILKLPISFREKLQTIGINVIKIWGWGKFKETKFIADYNEDPYEPLTQLANSYNIITANNKQKMLMYILNTYASYSGVSDFPIIDANCFICLKRWVDEYDSTDISSNNLIEEIQSEYLKLNIKHVDKDILRDAALYVTQFQKPFKPFIYDPYDSIINPVEVKNLFFSKYSVDGSDDVKATQQKSLTEQKELVVDEDGNAKEDRSSLDKVLRESDRMIHEEILHEQTQFFQFVVMTIEKSKANETSTATFGGRSSLRRTKKYIKGKKTYKPKKRMYYSKKIYGRKNIKQNHRTKRRWIRMKH